MRLTDVQIEKFGRPNQKSVLIYLFIYLFIQDGRFSIYIFTKYIKINTFQTSPVEKKRNKRLKMALKISANNEVLEQIKNNYEMEMVNEIFKQNNAGQVKPMLEN